MSASANLPPGCTQADIDRHFGGDAPEPECARLSCRYQHRRAKTVHHFHIVFTCAGEIEQGPRAGETCGHKYTIEAMPGDFGGWEPTGSRDCPVCGFDDNDFSDENVMCSDCGTEAPLYCFDCKNWGCVCPEEDPREEYQ